MIYYQGEDDNTGIYQAMFQAMIRDWRARWGQGDFPFLFVQLPGFRALQAQPVQVGEHCWGVMREAQMRALALPNTGMAVTLDTIDDPYNIHPLDKAPVGHRLALAALKVAYGEDLVYSGPMYDRMEVQGNAIRLHFTQVGGDGYTMLAKYDKTGEFGALDEALVKYIDQALGGTVGSSYAKAQDRIKVMLTPYTDTVNHWAKTSIKTVYDKNLFKGVTDTSFQPNAPMTRAMFVTVLGRINGADVSGYKETEFKDVPIGSWYGGYVEWASQNGIAAGISEDRFGPNTPITREQMATILTNYCKYIDKGPVGAWAIQLKYTDLDKISEWANEGVMFSTLKSYITGYPDGSFGPQQKATRAETAVIISRFLEEQVPPATTGSAITN
jgi:hypothetical protein